MFVRLSAALAALCLLSAPGFAQGGAKPTDPQIAHIAYTAGQLDIEAEKQALAKSKNKEVRDFADQMVRDHTEVNKQALALVEKLKVKPEDNDTSRSLTKQAAAKRGLRQGLRRQRGCLPQDGEWRAQKHSYSVGEQFPSASNPELKSLLQTGLKIFQGHQQHAEQIAAQIK